MGPHHHHLLQNHSGASASASHHRRPILLLPVEIIQHITTFLPLESRAAFALTCRSLWAIRTAEVCGTTFGIIATSTGALARLRLATWIERDEPHLYELCHPHSCVHLRPPASEEGLIRRGTSDRCNAAGAPEFRRVSFFGTWSFDFRDARKAMERHFHGPRYGMPLSRLAFSSGWEAESPLAFTAAPPAGVSFFRKLDVEPRIIGSELRLHTVQRIWLCPDGSIASRVAFAASMQALVLDDDLPLTTCRHGDAQGEPHATFGYSSLPGEVVRLCLHEVYRGVENEHLAKGQKTRRMGSLRLRARTKATKKEGASTQHRPESLAFQPPEGCKECPTTRMVTVYDAGRDMGAEIVFDVWQNVGDCRSPWQRGWYDCWGASRSGMGWQNIGHVEDLEAFVGSPGQSALQPCRSGLRQLDERCEYPFLHVYNGGAWTTTV